MRGNINDTMMSKAEQEAFEKQIGVSKKPVVKSARQKKGEELINYYKLKLAEACADFYKLVTEDEYDNEVLYQEHNKKWKQVANYANRLQKIITVNPFAFELQIEKYKNEARKRAKEEKDKAREKKEE